MILFDTETTGLIQNSAIPLKNQPRIIEFCAIKLDDKTLKEKAHLDFLIHPGMAISDEITKITGITNKDLVGKPSFGEKLAEISDFYLGERIMVAHNLDFDKRLLMFELQRLGREFSFPWPPRQICTVEATVYIKGKNMKLGDLYEHCTGHQIVGAHRAINDTRAMAECVRHLVKQGKIRV